MQGRQCIAGEAARRVSYGADKSSAILRKHLEAAREITPGISQEAQTRLVNSYGEMRKRWKRTTPKDLETLIKLAEASAKIRLDYEVNVEHVDEALELVGSTLGLEVWGSCQQTSSMPSKRARRHGA